MSESGHSSLSSRTGEQPIVALRAATKDYRVARETVHALRSTDLALQRGEFVVVTGRSGSGKTTLLNLAAGLARPSQGTVYIDGKDIWSLSDKFRTQIRREKLGFIFQFPSLVPHLSVRENVLLPATYSHGGLSSQVEERADNLLDSVGLNDKRKAKPAQLSAGQQQRVVIARALVCQPSLLVADEPTSNLDESTESEILELIGQVNKHTGVTVLMVTHSLNQVSCGTRHVVIDSGSAVEEGGSHG